MSLLPQTSTNLQPFWRRQQMQQQHPYGHSSPFYFKLYNPRVHFNEVSHFQTNYEPNNDTCLKCIHITHTPLCYYTKYSSRMRDFSRRCRFLKCNQRNRCTHAAIKSTLYTEGSIEYRCVCTCIGRSICKIRNGSTHVT